VKVIDFDISLCASMGPVRRRSPSTRLRERRESIAHAQRLHAKRTFIVPIRHPKIVQTILKRNKKTKNLPIFTLNKLKQSQV
jgi:hypothetical protein